VIRCLLQDGKEFIGAAMNAAMEMIQQHQEEEQAKAGGQS